MLQISSPVIRKIAPIPTRSRSANVELLLLTASARPVTRSILSAGAIRSPSVRAAETNLSEPVSENRTAGTRSDSAIQQTTGSASSIVFPRRRSRGFAETEKRERPAPSLLTTNPPARFTQEAHQAATRSNFCDEFFSNNKRQ